MLGNYRDGTLRFGKVWVYVEGWRRNINGTMRIKEGESVTKI